MSFPARHATISNTVHGVAIFDDGSLVTISDANTIRGLAGALWNTMWHRRDDGVFWKRSAPGIYQQAVESVSVIYQGSAKRRVRA